MSKVRRIDCNQCKHGKTKDIKSIRTEVEIERELRTRFLEKGLWPLNYTVKEGGETK